MALVVLLVPVLLTGCSDGADGKDGTNGTTWYNGTDDPSTTLGADGDYYIDTDDYLLYQKQSGSWIVIMTDFGKSGDSMYIGYDGYLWTGSQRSTYQVAEIDDDVAETTLGLYGSDVFDIEEVSAAGQSVALTGNYFSNIQKTGYSGVTITEISIYCTNAGILEIGTVDIGGSSFPTTAYSVKAGLNTIELSLEIGENQTLSFGGDKTTVGLYYAVGVPNYDEFGHFTTCSARTFPADFENSTTSGVANKLICEVKVECVGGSTTSTEEEQIFSDIISYFYDITAMSNINYSSSTNPTFTLLDTTLFEGKHISKIGIPIKYVNPSNIESLTSYTFSLFRVDADEMISTGNFTETSSYIVEKYTFTISADDLTNIASEYTDSYGYLVNQWIYVEVDIDVAEGETLCFGYYTDTILPAHYGGQAGSYYSLNQSQGSFGIYTSLASTPTRRPDNSIVYDVYASTLTTSISASTFSEHLKELAEEENEAIFSSCVSGKNISILGDSISTYYGYSNDSTNTNSTIGSNAIYYSDSADGVGNGCGALSSYADTWWAQAVSDLGMNLLVNNSYSSSRVANDKAGSGSAGYKRAENLHDNTGANAGTNPDIVAVYMGINDFDYNSSDSSSVGTFADIDFDTLITEFDGVYTYATPTTFAEAYAVTIHKIIYGYRADVFCFTLLPNKKNSDVDTLLLYNNVIVQVANYFGCGIVDLYNDSGITTSNYSEYMYDSNCLHPNAAGMDLITECFEKAMREYYVA